MALHHLSAAIAVISFLNFVGLTYAVDINNHLLSFVIVGFALSIFYIADKLKLLHVAGIISRAGTIGVAFGIGLHLITTLDDNENPKFVPFGTWLILLSMFHLSEYVSVALFCPVSLSLDSFLLNHSEAYHVAAMIAVFEYAVESYVFPGFKVHPIAQKVYYVGVGIALCGELIRKMAIFQAGTSFNHLVQHKRQPGHTLITNGVYAHCRHPSYFGWAMFALGTQIVLLNPICFVLYLPAIYVFFNKRINEEEQSLLAMFGDQYAAYMDKVPFAGIPGCGIDIPIQQIDAARAATATDAATVSEKQGDNDISGDSKKTS